MKKILTSIVFGLAVLTAFPALANSWDPRRGVDHGGRQHSGGYSQYHNNYGNRYYGNRHYHNNGHSNTTEKVVLAALLTGIIVDAAHRSKDKQPNVVYVSGYPQPTVTCTIREVYDHYGRRLTTERICY